LLQRSEVAEFRRDSAIEMIRRKVPGNDDKRIQSNWIIKAHCQEYQTRLSVQRIEPREVAELRRDGAIELIRAEIPERETENRDF